MKKEKSNQIKITNVYGGNNYSIIVILNDKKIPNAMISKINLQVEEFLKGKNKSLTFSGVVDIKEIIIINEDNNTESKEKKIRWIQPSKIKDNNPKDPEEDLEPRKTIPTKTLKVPNKESISKETKAKVKTLKIKQDDGSK